MADWSVETTNKEVPRSKREGIFVPPELVTAVEESYNAGVNKEIQVSTTDDVKQLERMFRSLRNRHGWIVRTHIEHDKKNNPISLVFKTVEQRPVNPDVHGQH